MPLPTEQLRTPILLKTGPDLPWPEKAPVFYMLTRDGLFLCRNHPFFRSSVRVDECPAELQRHSPFLELHYPRIPVQLLEHVVGFFALVGQVYASEAGVLLAWDKTAQRIIPIIPEQCGLVGRSWNGTYYPLELEYEVPTLPAHQMPNGDIHGHGDGPA